ncbi:MAG: aminotransferase class I/II-fold pyridoxal phosphate-dependent enzyme [Homoserinimonas sp.]
MYTPEIEKRTPAGIAAGVGRLISSGRLAVGDRLPTVRELATELGVSPATVSQAWQALAAAGLIVSRGRNGTFVRESAQQRTTTRSQLAVNNTLQPRLDLSRGTPDPALLPALGPALSRVSQRAETPSYQDLSVLPELLNLLRASWPYSAESFTIVNGALDALSRSLEQLTRFGDRVAVENPGFPPFFDLLDQLGLDRLPVDVDHHGMVPASLKQALGRSPSVVILQPRAHNPTGASMTPERAEELASLLRDQRAIIIEDDHSGDISTAPDVSLGRWLPDRVLHIRSYSKSHGPDLRIAALGGPADLIDRVVARRMLGPGWTSRMLQTILHDLLSNRASVTEVAEARRSYATRQKALADALNDLGLPVRQADGINAWLPVTDEQSAIVELAASGIRVAGGSPFFAVDSPEAFIRVTAGAVPDDVLPVAEALASAARAGAPGAHGLHARWA